jgi:carbohydrate binding protein with CBM4/9 domain
VDLANSTKLERNGSFETDTANWSGTAPGLAGATADITRSNGWSSPGNYSLRVSNRSSWQAGAVQRIDNFVKPGQQYTVSARVAAPSLLGTRTVSLTLYTKGTGNASASFNTNSVPASMTSVVLIALGGPVTLSGTVTAPPWSGDLEYAFIKISDDASRPHTGDLYIDNVQITQFASSGRHIYRQVLSPTVNTINGATNPEGIYQINCNGQRLTIERSRIVGTLLLINPGPNSGIADAPINWTPAVAGYPALLVEADDPSTLQFYLRATHRVLSEAEQLVNFNPPGAAHEQFGSDTNELNDIYPSMIRGLVAVEGDFAFQNQPRLLGQLLVGRSITNSAGELDVEYQADSLLNPPPGFLAPYTHSRRPGSVQKAVLP